MMLLTLFFVILTSINLVFGAVFDIYPQDSIQETVNLATNSDTLLIHDGDYYETVVLYGKTLTIGSLYLIDGDTSHIAQTVIHADPSRLDTNSCFVYSYGEMISGKLLGLTLTGGTGTNWVRQNESNFVGGAVYIYLSGITLDHCVIQNCSATYGGGIGATRIDQTIRTSVNLQKCKIQNCYSELWGGGVYAIDCSLTVKGCEIDSNVSASFQGGLSVLSSYMEMDSCFITYCQGRAGGMTFTGRGYVSNCLFENNEAHLNGYINDLQVFNSNVLISQNVFRNSGGLYPSILLDGYRNHNTAIRFIGNVIENNSTSIITATILVNDALGGDLAYNLIRNNVNVRGGAVYVFGQSNTRIHHNVFDHNVNTTVGDTLGSALFVLSFAHPTIDSNIFTDNNFPCMTAQIGIHNTNAHAENNWWGDPSGPYHPTLNPNGQGDSLISDSVYFIPWLTTPPDTTMPNRVDERERPEMLSTWQLTEVYPNPFNSSVRLVIAGFTGREFRLTLHNLLGQEIAEIAHGPITGGQIVYNAPANLGSGVYFVRANDQQFVQTKKIVFLK